MRQCFYQFCTQPATHGKRCALHDSEYRQRQVNSAAAAKMPPPPEIELANSTEYTVRINIDGMLLRLEEVYADSEEDARDMALAWTRKHFPDVDEDHLYATAKRD